MGRRFGGRAQRGAQTPLAGVRRLWGGPCGWPPPRGEPCAIPDTAGYQALGPASLAGSMQPLRVRDPARADPSPQAEPGALHDPTGDRRATGLVSYLSSARFPCKTAHGRIGGVRNVRARRLRSCGATDPVPWRLHPSRVSGRDVGHGDLSFKPRKAIVPPHPLCKVSMVFVPDVFSPSTRHPARAPPRHVPRRGCPAIGGTSARFHPSHLASHRGDEIRTCRRAPGSRSP